MSNIEYMKNIIADDFIECGKSGRFFYKNDTIEELSKLGRDRKIDIYNFSYEQLSEGVFLVHYITKNPNEKCVYRTSIWVDDNGLKLKFHQASVLNIDVELIKF